MLSNWFILLIGVLGVVSARPHQESSLEPQFDRDETVQIPEDAFMNRQDDQSSALVSRYLEAIADEDVVDSLFVARSAAPLALAEAEAFPGKTRSSSSISKPKDKGSSKSSNKSKDKGSKKTSKSSAVEKSKSHKPTAVQKKLAKQVKAGKSQVRAGSAKVGKGLGNIVHGKIGKGSQQIVRGTGKVATGVRKVTGAQVARLGHGIVNGARGTGRGVGRAAGTAGRFLGRNGDKIVTGVKTIEKVFDIFHKRDTEDGEFLVHWRREADGSMYVVRAIHLDGLEDEE